MFVSGLLAILFGPSFRPLITYKGAKVPLTLSVSLIQQYAVTNRLTLLKQLYLFDAVA